MRKIVIFLLLALFFALPAGATEEIDISELEDGLSAEAEELMPDTQGADFLDGLKELFSNTVDKLSSPFRDSLHLCALLLCVTMLCSLVDLSGIKNGSLLIRASGAVGLCAVMAGSFQTMISLASDTVQQISDYGACLLPIMASATAMSGGLTSASALYVGTVLFSQLLLQLISKLLIPAVYFYLAIATAEAALGNEMLTELREFVGWVISKSLRVLLYLFIAYLTITGVISGKTDAAAVKATKAAVSGMIPVVGSILSDASETLLAGASIVKSSAGVIGMLAVLAICLLPFLRTGVQYLMLKTTASVSGAIGLKAHVGLLKQFSVAMGYLLAMCGAGGLLMLISTVCFMQVG